MKKESEKKLIITLISIFVLVLAVLLIIFIAYSSIEDNKKETDNNTNINNILDKEQMKIDCINLGCNNNSNENQGDYIYAGSKNSDKYYECSCGYAKNILPQNLVCFASDEEAIADGRVSVEC